MTAVYVLNEQTHCSIDSIFLVGLFLRELVNVSRNVGSEPSLLGSNSSIPTYFCSHMRWASLKGTGGEYAPTTTTSVADCDAELDIIGGM